MRRGRTVLRSQKRREERLQRGPSARPLVTRTRPEDSGYAAQGDDWQMPTPAFERDGQFQSHAGFALDECLRRSAW